MLNIKKQYLGNLKRTKSMQKINYRRLRNYMIVGLVMIMLLIPMDYESQAEMIQTKEVQETPLPVPDSEVSEILSVERDTVKDCALNLLDSVRKTGTEAQKLPDLYRKHAAANDEEFLQYMFSIIYVESKFNRMAVSHAEAVGLMQMTAIAVEDAILHCNLRPLSDMSKLHDSVTNIRYGSCFLKKVLDEVNGDWTRALILYNGGYRQLTRYDKGETITSETANYVLSVHRVLKDICRAKRIEEVVDDK